MNIEMNNGRVVIDGREFKGNSVQIKNNKVIVDGVTQDGELVGDVNVSVYGDVEKLENSSGQVIVEGNAGDIRTQSGDVTIDSHVSGDIKTMSGDVTVNGSIAGSVTTMSGDIRGI